MTAELPDGYERIGRVAGTQIPIGISVLSLRGHHLGILGMSGTGKSTIARRVLHLLSNGGTAVAMDGTGAYRSRFGLAEWDATVGLSTDGASVFEPTAGSSTDKSSVAQARDFIKAARTAQSAISQCESCIILRTLDETSLQYVEFVVGAEYRDVASSLKRYHAICVGPAFSASVPVVVDLDPAIDLADDDSAEEDQSVPF